MRVGVISDIHSNVVALEAVLSDMPDVEELVCAGDVVGYGPWPAEAVQAMRSREVPTVMGNHDRKVATGTNFGANRMAQTGVTHARRELTNDQVEWLASLPDERSLFEDRLKVVHGHPADPDRYTYPEEFGAHLLEDESVLVMGHTHIQHVESTPEGLVLNPGSVGQPRDRDPRAAYAVVDLERETATPHRVEYDIERVATAVTEAGLPPETGSRLRDGR